MGTLMLEITLTLPTVLYCMKKKSGGDVLDYFNCLPDEDHEVLVVPKSF